LLQLLLSSRMYQLTLKMSETFKKHKEDFTCVNCENKVSGNGYTNHCPKCLWSRHVDIFPGDRAEECGGPMEPIAAEKDGDSWSLLHKCLKCHKMKRNKLHKDDNFDLAIKLVSESDIPFT